MTGISRDRAPPLPPRPCESPVVALPNRNANLSVKYYMDHVKRKCKIGFDQVHTELRGFFHLKTPKAPHVQRQGAGTDTAGRRRTPWSSTTRPDASCCQDLPDLNRPPARPPKPRGKYHSYVVESHGGSFHQAESMGQFRTGSTKQVCRQPSARQSSTEYAHKASHPNEATVSSGVHKLSDSYLELKTLNNDIAVSGADSDEEIHEYDEIEDLLPSASGNDPLQADSIYEIASDESTKQLFAVYTSMKTQLCFGLSASELEYCLRECGLRRVAAAFKENNIDGYRLRSMCQLDLLQEPFSLAATEMRDLARVINGWRPWLDS